MAPPAAHYLGLVTSLTCQLKIYLLSKEKNVYINYNCFFLLNYELGAWGRAEGGVGWGRGDGSGWYQGGIGGTQLAPLYLIMGVLLFIYSFLKLCKLIETSSIRLPWWSQ